MMLVPETQVSCCLVTGFYVKNKLETPTNQLQDTELFLKSSCPEGRPATYSTDTRGSYPRVKRRNVNLIYHFHLSTRLRMSGSVPLLRPPSRRGAHRDNFTFPYSSSRRGYIQWLLL